jgi:hypothetical protein
MSEEFALEVLTEFLNAVEAGVSAAKQRMKEKMKLEENLDFSKLFWEEKQGEKGPFSQTSEKANQNSILWQQLKAKLKEHQGFWQNSGFKFWFDLKNETVIDRRKVA